jgi:hypothetical protein
MINWNNKINSLKQTPEYIYKSIAINAKSWTLLLLSILILSYNDIFNGLLTFFYMLFASHIFHYFCHLALYTNSVHLYHHNHNNFLSHFTQVILEFCSSLFFIFTKKLCNWHFLNVGIIIYYYIFYTTVHNINYSVFHVNNVHENHHKLLLLNLGPDICDILFQTKFDINNSIEQTDHYIPNILLTLLVVLICKLIWSHASFGEKNIITNIFIFIYGIFSLLLIYYTIYFNFIH